VTTANNQTHSPPQQIKTPFKCRGQLVTTVPFLALETWEREGCAAVGTAVLHWLQHLPEMHSVLQARNHFSVLKLYCPWPAKMKGERSWAGPAPADQPEEGRKSSVHLSDSYEVETNLSLRRWV